MERLAQQALPLAVHQAHHALAAQERRVQEAVGFGQGLGRPQAVEIEFRHVGARFGLEQQGVEGVERRERRHGAGV